MVRWAWCFVVVAAVPAGAQEWTRFRGPNGSGLSPDKSIPTSWTDKDYAWTVDLPGNGHSSPVIWQDKLFVTAADEKALVRQLLCLSTTDGRLLWSKSWPFEKEKKHAANTFATNTPTCDAERVYVVWQARAESQLLAFDHAGQEQWRHDLGPFASGHGGGTSPIVVGDHVLLNYNQEGDSRLLAVHRKTGTLAWKTPREKAKASYSTPCVFRTADGREEAIFTSWLQGITSVDPLTGRVLWERAVFNPDDEERRAIGSPFVAGDLVYGNAGFAGGKKFLVALRSQGEKVDEVFRLEKGANHQPTAIAYENLLFAWNDQGVVTCLARDSGTQHWQKRIGGNYAGSPVCIGGRLYAMSQDGTLVVLAASAEFQELAKIELPEGSSATPAVSGGRLFLRTHRKLLAVGSEK